MTAAVFDFSDIKRRAMFPANRPQDGGTPVIPTVQQFDEWGMYAGFQSTVDLPHIEELHQPLIMIDGRAPDVTVTDLSGSVTYFWSAADGCYLPIVDTAPSEYLAQDFDQA